MRKKTDQHVDRLQEPLEQSAGLTTTLESEHGAARMSPRPARTPEHVLQRLIAVGFTKYEAMAYLILLQDHPLTAYEISKKGALAKGNVYAALKTLVAKSAAQPVTQDPVRYAPVEPEVLFGQISKKMSGLCQDLASTLARQESKRGTEYVWTLNGEETIDEKIADMIARARRQVWIKGPIHLLSRYLAPLRKATRRGVRVLVILFGDRAGARGLRLGSQSKIYLHEGTGEMLAVGRHQFVIATDFEETLIANFGEQSEGAYTRSDAVVFTAETMIRHEVYLAEIINEYGPAIEKRFGKDLISLRSKYLPPPLLREFEKRAGSLAKNGPRASRIGG